ncbi:VWA domain-containing protein [Hyphomonas sp.]|uniref:vWA domain-containing protein n=1 Tax=Hyphomonas sp. TaxID=87 RepID=UPI003529D0EB
MKSIRTFVLGTAIAASLSVSAMAEDPAPPDDAILVLDASGSMWGQIDGVNKIVIAKDVVEGLVRGLDDDQRLGFVAYGHRKGGDCSDIETLADVGADRDAVIEALRGLTPRGKTPLSKSIEHAANTLNYREKAASVILVSDGLETCSADPCALARTLEENGLDFTVHVVGFDVTVEERAGLQCIADETGGTFVAADNAEELAGALTQMTDAGGETEHATSTPVPASLAMKATILSGGPLIQSKLDWTVTPSSGGDPVFTITDTGSANTEILPGDYVAEVSWKGWKDGSEVKTGQMAFSVGSQQPKVITVPIDLGFTVSLDADDETQEGVAFNVTWSGPDELGTYIQVASREDGPREAIYFLGGKKTRDQGGVTDSSQPFTSQIGAPSMEGEYEVRYVLDQPRLILARTPLTVTDGGFGVTAPEEAPVSSVVKVGWSGEATPGDFVTIIEAGDAKAFNNGFTGKLKDDGTAELTMPAEPGDYEIRYVLANGYSPYPDTQYAVQATVPIRLTPVEAGISGPTEAIGGSQVGISVELPADWEDDYVSIAEVGATRFNRDSWATLGRADAADGTLELQAPNIEGDYELVYFLAPGDSVLARQPITITRAPATVDAPAQVKIGENFDVTWTGPAYKGDRIIIAPADVADSKMWGWGTRYGVAVPEGETNSGGTVANYQFTEPGAYEARYVTGLQHQVLARDTFTVVE